MQRLTKEKVRAIAEIVNREGGIIPGGFYIESAGLENVDEILAVGAACFDYNPPTRREIRHNVDPKSHGACFVFRTVGDKKAMGYFLLEGHMGRRSIYANTTAFLADYRGQGLGQATYKLKDKIAAYLGVETFWAHVSEDNAPVIHLLEKNGFKRVRTEEKYYDDGKAAHVYKKEYIQK